MPALQPELVVGVLEQCAPPPRRRALENPHHRGLPPIVSTRGWADQPADLLTQTIPPDTPFPTALPRGACGVPTARPPLADLAAAAPEQLSAVRATSKLRQAMLSWVGG